MVNMDDKRTPEEELLENEHRKIEAEKKERAIRYQDRFTGKEKIATGEGTKIKSYDQIRATTVKMKEGKGYRVFTIFNTALMIVISIVTLFPFMYLVAQSFSSNTAIDKGLIYLWPVEFNITTYVSIIQKGEFLKYYGNTVIYTLVGTFFSLFLTSFIAYPLSKTHLRANKIITPIVIFTMYFGAGLVPNYVLMMRLGLRETVAAFLLPGMIGTFYVLLMRAFFINTPRELEEAGELDGLSPFGVFFRIVIPLSKPIIATMTLFYAVSYWNGWFNAFLYLNSVREKWPVAWYLRTIIVGASTSSDPGQVSAETQQVAANIKSCAMVLMVIPIVCAYPIVQRYYVQGMTLGSVKE